MDRSEYCAKHIAFLVRSATIVTVDGARGDDMNKF